MTLEGFHTLIHAYCTHTDLSPYCTDDGHYVLMSQTQQALILAWDANTEEIALVAPVQTSAPEIEIKEMRALMTDAYLGQRLGGAAVGLDPDTGNLVLWRRLPTYGLTLDTLTHYVASTLAAAQALQSD